MWHWYRHDIGIIGMAIGMVTPATARLPIIKICRIKKRVKIREPYLLRIAASRFSRFVMQV